MVSTGFGGRLGNCVLHVYRAFWFAKMHGMPDDSVVLPRDCHIMRFRIGDTVRRYSLPNDQYNRIAFDNKVDCDVRSQTKLRKMLAEMDISEHENTLLTGWTFLFPELPWEKALFARLFDNKGMRMSVLETYGHVLCGPTVGYTIRRTDALRYGLYRKLTEDDVVSDIRKIVARHEGFVRILICSDDDAYIDGIVAKNPDIAKYVYHIREREDMTLYLLSMCDYVFNNGDAECTSGVIKKADGVRHLSTFGAIAQLLNRSYKYADLDINPGDELGDAYKTGVSSGNTCGCDFAYPIDGR